jgi:hypothetical protein
MRYFIQLLMAAVLLVSCQGAQQDEQAGQPGETKAVEETTVLATSATFASVRRIVSDIKALPEDQINPASMLDEIGLEGGKGNPDFLEFIIQIENEFQVEIPEDSIANMPTIGEWCVFIDSLPRKDNP